MRSTPIVAARVLPGLLVIWLLLAALGAGCSRCGEPGKDANGALVVSAPAAVLARLGPMIEMYKRQFPDERITLLANGGQPLANRDTADIFIVSASEQADALKKGVKLVEPPQVYILDRVILVGRAGNAKDISRPKHLLQPAFKGLVLPPESDPAGAAARDLLKSWRMAKRLAPRINVAEDSGKALQELIRGRADGAFVLQSDVRKNTEVVPLLPRYMREQSFITYSIALSADPARHNRAKSLMTFLTSSGVIKGLVKAGYLLPGAKYLPAPQAGPEKKPVKRPQKAPEAEATKAGAKASADAPDAAKKPKKTEAPAGDKKATVDKATEGAPVGTKPAATPKPAQ